MNPARLIAKLAVGVTVLAVIGVVVSLVLNMFVLDGYRDYGEVPIPGSASLRLPAGELTATFHTRVIGSPSGGGLPLPEIGLAIIPPQGVTIPTVTESIGVTTTFNNDARRRVASVRVPAEGVYTIRTDAQVGGFIAPRLAFGRQSSYGFLPWVFAGLFVGAVLTLIVVRRWSARGLRVRTSTAKRATPDELYTPNDEGVRVEQLKTIAALRDSGALTQAEFEAEKRRILDGR